MDTIYREAIKDEFKSCVNNTLRRLRGRPTYRPFHQALLSPEAMIWSRFERSFSTSFGQRAIEIISKYVCLAYGASEAQTQKETRISLNTNILNAIDNHLADLRNNNLRRAPDWNVTFSNLNDIQPTGNTVQRRIISDLWFKKNGIESFVSIKTVKPNIDQTEIAKKDLLSLKLFDNSFQVFFGLYYNPFGENRSDYNFSPPTTIFNMCKDPVVLIGREYWETIGGEGAYGEVLSIAKEVGDYTRQAIADARDNLAY